MLWRTAFAAALLLAATTPAGAQPQPRSLAVPADKGWGHAATGLALPPTVASLPRTELSDVTTSELDVIAHYRASGGDEVVSVFLFRPAVGGAALWFDRARAALLANPQLGEAEGDAPIRAVELMGGARGYRTVFDFAGRLQSSGVALVPLGAWLAKVRLTSATLDAAALDARLDTVLREIRWPAPLPPTPADPPIAVCSDSIRFKRARQLPPDMGQTLMSSIFSIGALRGTATSNVTSYCRNGPARPNYAVYRGDGARDSYLLALGDSGRVVQVDKAPNITGRSGSSYTVTMLDLDRALVFPSFDRLPGPDQVWTVVMSGRPLSSSGTQRDADRR